MLDSRRVPRRLRNADATMSTPGLRLPSRWTSSGFVDTWLSCRGSVFAYWLDARRAEVANRRMPSLPNVEELEVLERLAPRCGPCGAGRVAVRLGVQDGLVMMPALRNE
jgi:hypothetical protein